MKVYEITAKYPPEEKYGLTSDTRRSGNSVIANIAEAHGRYYHADKVRVLFIARGEIEEIRSHILVARGLNYIEPEESDNIDKEYEGLGVGINLYITSLKNPDKNITTSQNNI